MKTPYIPRLANIRAPGDITYIHTEEGWLYLAVVIDLFSRQVVGWSMPGRMQSKLVNDVLLIPNGHKWRPLGYNRERLHSTNNYLSPVDYEMQFKDALSAR